MGGATSKFYDTDWETADGGLKNEPQTLDGSKPVEEYSKFQIVKQKHWGRRGYKVLNDKGETLYTTRKVKGTETRFDVFDADEKVLFRVQSSAIGTKWTIYSFDKRTFDGQRAYAKASKKTEHDNFLYKKARVTLPIYRTGNPGKVYMYEAPILEQGTTAQEAEVIAQYPKKPVSSTTCDKGQTATNLPDPPEIVSGQPLVDEQDAIAIAYCQEDQPVAPPSVGRHAACSLKSHDPTGVLSDEPILTVARIRGEASRYQTQLQSKDKDKDNDTLVGYWCWSNRVTELKMDLHLTKGTDLLLHVILAILTDLDKADGLFDFIDEAAEEGEDYIAF